PNAYRTILMDIGHVCQNLYLACQSLGLGTCAIAAYFQKALDEIFQLDGEEEFSVYLSPVGVLK
ncbi:MAG: nitroreductase family protein, partial [Thermotogota bacterium]